MNQDEWQTIRRYIEDKSTHLLHHEKKDFAYVGLSPDRFQRIAIGNRIFYTISTRVFEIVLCNDLPKANQEYAHKFGSYNAYDVIEAIHNVAATHITLKEFPCFLGNEKFAYVVELCDGQVVDKLLRVDLFRLIEQDDNGNFDFTGGLFHAFKHFSYKGVPLSTHREVNDLVQPHRIILRIIKAFFIEEGYQENETNYVSHISLNDRYDLQVNFYLEVNTGVYFIKSARKQSNKRRKKKSL